MSKFNDNPIPFDEEFPPIAKVPMTIILGIITELRAAGFVAGIAGGYARDMYYGDTPKDVDVVISMEGGMSDSDYFLEAEHISSKLSSLGYASITHQAYMQHPEVELEEEHKGRRLSCVLTSEGCDFIFYVEAKDLSEIVSQFDFNLNQFVLGESGRPVYLGDNPHPTGELVQLRPILPERQAYIQTKHKELLKCLAKKQA